MTNFYLSKTDFMRWLTCPAYAWIAKYKKELIPEEEDRYILERIFAVGFEVEDYALTLFPPGKRVQAFGPRAAEFTGTLASEGKRVIHQATALSPEGYMARADILVKDDAGDGWHIYEVKSSTRVKNEHLLDVAFQRLAFERAGYTITKTCVIHLNRNYVRQGALDPKEMLRTVDVSHRVEKLLPGVTKQAAEAATYMQSPIEPTTCTCNRRANKWERCPTVHYFHPDMLEKSIFHVSGLGERLFKSLVNKEIFTVEEIPDGVKLTDKLHHYRLALKEGKAVVNEQKISQILDGLEFPLYFLDYETTTSGLPLFDGTMPYQNMPFQYSLHVLREPGGELEHYEYLATNQTADPVGELCSTLAEAIPPTGGTVLVWYAPFETGCNEQMARMRPEHTDFLKSVNARVFDLMTIFSDFHYLHPGFEGSASIKKVLPVIVPELSYDNLAVQKGDRASALWEDSLKPDFKQDRDQLYSDLLEYCKLDTLAMVKIYEHLVEICSQSQKAPAEASA